MKPIKHGTTTGYGRGCRCAACKQAVTEYQRRRLGSKPRATLKHGTVSGYGHYKCRCGECRSAWAASRRDYNRGKAAEYRQLPARQDYERAYQAEYRKRKRDEKLAYLREWQATPHGRAADRKSKGTRRARKLAQFIEDVAPCVVWEMHGGRCGICGEFVPLERFHVDHVIPLSRGGLHGYVNCQPAHPGCNLSKGAKLAA